MKRRAGFTLVELLITISIMVILLLLTVVSLRGNQAAARDEERKSDALAIAQQLEAYYRSGSDSSGPYTYKAGQYPPTIYINSESGITSALRDIDPNVLRAPDVALSSTMSFTVATSTATQTPDTNTYIYQPIDRSGALCNYDGDYCSKFTIYYMLETNATVQQVTSKHQ
jgi:prepilin-type N-terminal cleavage/methylation domain-containing protein